MRANSKAEFDHLLNSVEFAEFTRLLARLTGLRVTFHDLTDQRLTPQFQDSFVAPLCRLIHKNPVGAERCLTTDRENVRKAIRMRQKVSFTCHAGLIDILAPVFSEGHYLCIMSCGQFLPTPPSEEGLAAFCECTRDLALDPEAVRKAYYQMRYLPVEMMEAVGDLLMFFSAHIREVGRRIHLLEEQLGRDEIYAAKEYIEDHFREDITLGQVAEYVGFERTYFSRLFSAKAGMGFSEFLQRARVEEAKKLLGEDSGNVTKIAFQCGFRSFSQFSRVFRKITKCTPSQYRKRTSKEKK